MKGVDKPLLLWYNRYIHYLIYSISLCIFTYLIYFMKDLMKKYSTLWTQFETQSLAFGLLRKALYPNYLVRGDYGKIEIYRAMLDKNNPIHVLTLNVHASTKKEEDTLLQISEQEYTVVGGQTARNIVMKVVPILTARAEGSQRRPSPV